MFVTDVNAGKIRFLGKWICNSKQMNSKLRGRICRVCTRHICQLFSFSLTKPNIQFCNASLIFIFMLSGFSTNPDFHARKACSGSPAWTCSILSSFVLRLSYLEPAVPINKVKNENIIRSKIKVKEVLMIGRRQAIVKLTPVERSRGSIRR